MKERVTFPDDFWEMGRFFFMAPQSFDPQVISKKWNQEAVDVLGAYIKALSPLSTLTTELAKSTLETTTQQLGIGTGKILQALRVSLTGSASGPDLMMTMEILGKEEVISRIETALRLLPLKAA